jgi:hypothetical protein
LVESFNGNAREECLNEHWFTDLLDARTKIESWWEDSTKSVPTARSGTFPPAELARTVA